MATIAMSELAKKCGTSARAIRHYEAIGLITRVASGGVERTFDRGVINVAMQIVGLRTLGLTLEEIGVLLGRSLRAAPDFRPSTLPPSRREVLAKLEGMHVLAGRLIRELNRGNARPRIANDVS